MKARLWWIGAALLVLAGACAPLERQVAPPVARLLDTELLALDPFADRLRLSLLLELTNPNPFDLPLVESELRVRLGELTTAAALPRLTLPARGRTRATVRVETGLASAAATAAELVSGRSLPLTMSGRLRVEAFGQGLWLGPYTLLRDRVRLAVALAPPKIEPIAAEVRLGFGTLAFSVRYRAKNVVPVGFVLDGTLLARVGGYRLGEAPIRFELPPAGEREGEFLLEVPLTAVPGAARALSGGAPFELVGRVRLSVPGVIERTYELELSGVAR